MTSTCSLLFDGSRVWSRYQYDSKQLLYRVREALTGYRVKTAGSRGQAVRLFYDSPPNVDITPAFVKYDLLRRPSGYVIPRGDGRWQGTNPYIHHDFMVRRSKELDGYLKPLVRLLKRWNRVHSNRLGSFHLELITQAVFGKIGAEHPGRGRVLLPARRQGPSRAGPGGVRRGVEPAKHQRPMANSRVCARWASKHVIRSRFPKPRLFRPRPGCRPSARVGVTRRGNTSRDECGSGRVEVERAVHVEREPAVGVDVSPEQGRERAAVGRGQAAGAAGPRWFGEDGFDEHRVDCGRR
jgi:hypothetical protein